MGVQSAATTGASRNLVGPCTRGPASWADLAVRVNRGKNLLIQQVSSIVDTAARYDFQTSLKRCFAFECTR